MSRDRGKKILKCVSSKSFTQVRKLIFTVYLLTVLFSCSSQKVIHREDDRYKIIRTAQNYFDKCNVKGSTTLFDNQKQEWIYTDSIDANTMTLPASTFKVINLLIALETGTIKDENEIIKWPGSTDTLKYGYRPEIYHDISVKEAFRLSAGWAFIELAKRIGKKNYRKYLDACQYSNLNLSHQDDDFWNFGFFGVSPVNQVDFLRRLYMETLPFSKNNLQLVKKIMTSEVGKDYSIHSKTGWTRYGGINTGWWIGYIESANGVYFFATRIMQNRQKRDENFGSCRIQITKSILSDLGILNYKN